MNKGGEHQDNEGSSNEQNVVCSWNLPEEVYLNIFSRLHIRCLIRCRCVSKLWHTLISDPYLVSMHLAHAQGKDPDLILVVHEYEKVDEGNNYEIRKRLYTIENIGCNDEAMKSLPLPPIDFNPFAFCIKGSCNGLIWLTNYLTPCSKSFSVWNPCTGEILQLPSPRTMTSRTKILFGFDHNSSLNNDYKLFGLLLSTSGSDTNLEAEVWTLGSASWRSIGKVPFTPKFSSDCVSTVGALHWLSEDIHPHSVHVGVNSFDIVNKEFQFTALPRKITCGDCYSIGSLGDCLSAVDYSFPRHIPIWILKQLGVKEFWTKQYVISIDEEDIFQLRLLCLF